LPLSPRASLGSLSPIPSPSKEIEERVGWVTVAELNQLLQIALKQSDQDMDPYTENLSMMLDHSVDPAQPHTVEATDCVQMSYQVQWPLTVILHEAALIKYRRIFGFLLRNKHVLYVQRTIWKEFNGLNKASQPEDPAQQRLHRERLRKLQLFRREIQHFVTTLLNSIAAQVLEVTWREFTDTITGGKVLDVEDLRRAHDQYLDHAMTRCLLSDRATPVRNIVTSIYSLILKLRFQVISSSAETHGLLSDKAYQDMLRTWRSFRKHAHFLYIVLVKQVARTGDHYLQDLLLRLNFNYFYERADTLQLD